jgi:hypothetical protein
MQARAGLLSVSSVRFLVVLCRLFANEGCAGACIGVNAALISIITEWLSDLKTGYCYDGWWLNQQFCCWEIEYEDESACESWHSWSDVTPAQWIIYVMFAVRVKVYGEASVDSMAPRLRFLSQLHISLRILRSTPQGLEYLRSSAFLQVSL